MNEIDDQENAYDDKDSIAYKKPKVQKSLEQNFY
jgi:hypothetical protein